MSKKAFNSDTSNAIKEEANRYNKRIKKREYDSRPNSNVNLFSQIQVQMNNLQNTNATGNAAVTDPHYTPDNFIGNLPTQESANFNFHRSILDTLHGSIHNQSINLLQIHPKQKVNEFNLDNSCQEPLENILFHTPNYIPEQNNEKIEAYRQTEGVYNQHYTPNNSIRNLPNQESDFNFQKYLDYLCQVPSENDLFDVFPPKQDSI